MDPTLPWYKAAILRQQIVQLLIAACTLFGVNTDGINWDETVASIFAGYAGVVAVWTILTRLFKPAPNVTQLAADRERELVRAGKAPRQAGYARLSQLILVAAVALSVIALAGCGGTVLAYRSANTLPDTAYVVAEHYAALVKQAADIAERPGTPESVKETLKSADRAVKPLIFGDDRTNTPGLRDLADRYRQVRDAQTEEDLQRAVDNAVRELTHFINAVKSARSQTHALTVNPRTNRNSRRCLGAGAPGAEERGGPAVCFS